MHENGGRGMTGVPQAHSPSPTRLNTWSCVLSAGTSKIPIVWRRAYLLALLRRGAAPGTILATTFTRKAAGEILGRVLVRPGQRRASKITKPANWLLTWAIPR